MKLIECNQGEFIWAQVSSNDTINSLLQKYNVGISSLIRNNPSIDLYEGEVVKIIRKTKLHHVVKPMETLIDISQKYGVSIDELIKWNNLTSKRLFVGQTLIIDNSNL